MRGMSSPDRPARLVDVARRADVSITTVSHVVNGTRYVAPDTRERVERALTELTYDRPVQKQAQHTGGAVGLALTGTSNPYIGELIQGVESELSRAGMALLLMDTHDDREREAQSVATLLGRQVEAIILAPSAGWEHATLPLLRRHGTTFVLVDRLSDARCDQVGTESEAAAFALVDHLLDRGHRRVAMLSGLPGLSTTTERERGYTRALRAAGLSPDPQLLAAGRSSVDGGRAAVQRLLTLRQRPTAVFSGNNAMTVGALIALKEAGLTVPDDVALVTFDDFEWASALSPALTAAAQPFHAMGSMAVQLLTRRLADPAAPQRVMRLPVEIQHRESCGCTPAAGDLPVAEPDSPPRTRWSARAGRT